MNSYEVNSWNKRPSEEPEEVERFKSAHMLLSEADGLIDALQKYATPTNVSRTYEIPAMPYSTFKYPDALFKRYKDDNYKSISITSTLNDDGPFTTIQLIKAGEIVHISRSGLFPEPETNDAVIKISEDKIEEIDRVPNSQINSFLNSIAGVKPGSTDTYLQRTKTESLADTVNAEEMLDALSKNSIRKSTSHTYELEDGSSVWFSTEGDSLDEKLIHFSINYLDYDMQRMSAVIDVQKGLEVVFTQQTVDGLINIHPTEDDYSVVLNTMEDLRNSVLSKYGLDQPNTSQEWL